MSAAQGQAPTQAHLAVFEEGAWRLECHAPLDAPCRARFDCGCESLDAYDVMDGQPVHLGYDAAGDTDRLHIGTWWDAEWCNICEWFSADGGEEMERVAVWVTPRWKGDFYSYETAADLMRPTTIEGTQ